MLMVLWALGWGVASNKLLSWAGVMSPPWRYALATLIAWLAMLVALRLWLSYVGLASQFERQRSGSGSDLPSIDVPLGRNSTSVEFSGSGGEFSGGGASNNFEIDADLTGSASIDGASSLGDIVSELDDLPGLVVIVGWLAIAACGGVLLYFYAQGPMLLSELAFEALLAGGLIKTARKADQASWLSAAIKSTIVPFLAVLTGAIVVGLLMR